MKSHDHHPLNRTQRRTAWVCVELTLLTLAVLALGFRFWWQRRLTIWEERKAELLELTRKAEPLIAALEAYRRDHKRYPDELEELVPRYLPRIPEPTAVAERSWIYDTGQNISAQCRSTNLSYDLSVDVRHDFCPLCFVSFGDMFAYHHTGIYPGAAHGGGLERIGKWGYYHE